MNFKSLTFSYSPSRKYLQKSQFAIPDDLRKEVNRRVKEGKELLHPGVFDDVQIAVEKLISHTTYPNFLKSELYLQHVQSMQVKRQAFRACIVIDHYYVCIIE